MSSLINFTPIEVKCKPFLFRKLLIAIVPAVLMILSSMAFALDGTTAKYVGSEAGGWSGTNETTGVPDGNCANMGAVGKVNTVYNFGFNIPADAEVVGITAFIKAGATTDQDVSVALSLDASDDTAPAVVGNSQILTAFGSGSGNCASTVVDQVGPALNDWGLGADPFTPAEVNNATFGLIFVKLETSTIKVDSICLQIDYTTTTGPALAESCFALDPVLTLVKDVTSDNGGTAADTAFTLTATGPDVISGVEGDAAITSATVLAGDYALTESSVTGYAPSSPTALSCDGGSLAGNTLTLVDSDVVTCTFFNNDVQPLLTVTKTVVNDNGGTLVVSDFPLFVDATPVTSGVQNGFNAGSYTVSETPDSAYTASSWGGDCAADGSVTLSVGDVKTCTITNNDKQPLLTVTKTVVNDDGGTLVVSDFPLFVDATPVTSGVQNGFNAGSYTVSETPDSAYTASSWGGDCAADGSVTLAAGDVKTCTITNNDKQPLLTVTKFVTNNNGGTLVVSDFPLFVDATPVTSGVQNGFSAGTYTVSETPDAGYTASAWGGDCAANGSVTLAAGDVKACTITNDDKAAGLTIVKTIASDNGGTATLDDFDVSVDAVEVPWDDATSTTGGSKLVTTNAGTYTLSEGTVDGYTPGVWSCSDASGVVAVTNEGLASGADVTVALGQAVTCMITNADDDTALIVSKTIASDNGGTATLDDFDVSVDAVEVAWVDATSTTGEMKTVTDQLGTYLLAETDYAGYTEGTWSCSDSEGPVEVSNSGSFDGSSVTIALGQVVTCSITNTDDQPLLTVTKSVTNDNGGTKVVSDFALFVDATGVTSGAQTGFDAGNYTVSETPDTGYLAGDWGGDCAADGSITLAVGDVKTCTITNDDIQPLLTVTKTVTNNNGGSKVVSDFPLFVGATGVTSGVQGGFNAGNYTVSETPDAGYTASAWGGDCADDGSITLAVGDVKTCSITNDDKPAHLTLIKLVVNVGLSSAVPSDWQLFATGPTSIDGAGGVEDDVNAGFYTLSETLLNGDVEIGGVFAPSAWECEGGSLSGSGLTLANGDVAVCTITNTFIPLVAVPVNNPLALLLMMLAMLATGLYFKPAVSRKF